MIAGMLEDKDTNHILKSFCEITSEFVATEPDNPRKMSKETLEEKLRDFGVHCLTAGSPEEACMFAAEHKDDYDVILFAGSLYLIGQIRTILRRTWEG